MTYMPVVAVAWLTLILAVADARAQDPLQFSKAADELSAEEWDAAKRQILVRYPDADALTRERWGEDLDISCAFAAWADVHSGGDLELVLRVQIFGYCGTGGCPTFVLERDGAEWVTLLELGTFDVWVEPNPEYDYATVRTPWSGFRWNGAKYEYFCTDVRICGG